MYLGNQPALAYTSFAKQDFTTSATTSYTLDNPVANENEIALFINFVRQEPTTAYTASGTSLTLTSATSASDDMYCVYLGKAVQTVNPPAGSVGLSQLSATGTKDATTFLRGDNTFASAGGTNTPIIYAQASTVTSMTNGVTTKITLDNEIIDTDGVFASSRFTVTSAGKYLIIGQVSVNLTSSTAAVNSFIRVNNVDKSFGLANSNQASANTVNARTSIIIDLSVSDYVELFGYHNNGNTINTNTNYYTNLSITKLVE